MLALSFMGVAVSSLQSTPNQRTDPELPPLPPLISLGLGMKGERDAAPVVGACACHSPFAKALFLGGDRILSVNGTTVRSVQEVSLALSLARPKRSIEFVILPELRLEGTPPKTVIVEFPPSWWRVAPRK